jgi:hypothetical protein
MPVSQTSPYGVAPWGRHQFMTRCVASESTLMFHPAGLTHNEPTTTANTACARFRRRYSGHPVQQLTLPPTPTVGRGHILRVCQQPTDNRRPPCGDRKRPFPQKPTHDNRPDTPPARPRLPPPIATLQPRAPRQMMRYSPRRR